MDLVWKSFIKNHSSAKSRDDLSDFSKGQASSPYSSMEIHLLAIICNVTSSEAIPPILPNTELAARQKDIFALSRENLNTRERTIYTPSYLSLSTHIVLSTDDIQYKRHYFSDQFLHNTITQFTCVNYHVDCNKLLLTYS